MTDQPAPPSTHPRIAEQPNQLARVVAQIGAEFARLAEAIGPAATALGQQLAALNSALHGAGVIDADGNPAHATDRPAWQTPYGPPQHRH